MSSPLRRVLALSLTAAPTVAFLVGQVATGSLGWSVVVAGAVAVGVFAVRLLHREPLRPALLGLVVVAACAGVAVTTGQARGFFLLPTLVPFAVLVVCLATVLVGRPLTGLVLNRVAGGPPDWFRHRRLRRVHTTATLACVVVNVVNGLVQVVSYRAADTVTLGIAHLATGPVFAAIVAVTLVTARREIATLRTPDRAPVVGP